MSRVLGRNPPKRVLWQELGQGSDRWEAITGKVPEDAFLRKQSPFHFRQKLYDELLPLMQTAAALEGEDPEVGKEWAYKLAVLFNSRREVDDYLDRFAENWATGNGEKLVHDACLFDLPQQGTWNADGWKELVRTYGPDAAKFISLGAKIEQKIKDSNRQGEALEFPKTLNELRDVAATLSYKQGAEHSEWAKIALKNGISEEDFDLGLKVMKRANKKDILPNITIDGATVGMPDFYMEKLPAGNPLGLVLGKITDCCQHIAHKAGRQCVVFGMTNEKSGFYVWKKKTKGNITSNDDIIAQSWVWVGDDNNIVFDSFEPLDKKNHRNIVQPFIEQYAALIDREGKFAGVRLGEGGYTPRLNLARAQKNTTTEQYKGYSDANGFHYQWNAEQNRYIPIAPVRQYIITPKDHATKQEVLPPPGNDKEAELAARNYIRAAVKRIEETYGIKIRTGIELEFYAIGPDGQPTSQILDVEKINAAFEKHSPVVSRFDHENYTDYYGQYEVVIGVDPPKGRPKYLRELSPLNRGERRRQWEAMPEGKPMERNDLHGDPMHTAVAAQETRKFLQREAKNYGLSKVDFTAKPFADKEASGAHLSVSLWDNNGKPLFANAAGHETTLLKQVARGMAEVQKDTVLLYAPTDNAFERLANTMWSPSVVSVATAGDAGTTLRIAKRNDFAYETKEHIRPEDVRIENRLPASDCNYILAMAGTIAGIEHALRKHVKVYAKDTQETGIENRAQKDIIKLPDKILAIDKAEDTYPVFTLPASRKDALERLQRAASSDTGKILGNSFISAIMAQQKASVPSQAIVG